VGAIPVRFDRGIALLFISDIHVCTQVVGQKIPEAIEARRHPYQFFLDQKIVAIDN
jgi:hypothetical protein